MKTKEKCIYNVKIGETVVVGDYSGKIIGIAKRRGIFMYGTVFQVMTNNWNIGTLTVWGKHMSEGRKYPAEKLTIAI